MKRPCPKCGADLNIVGKAHNCRPRVLETAEIGPGKVARASGVALLDPTDPRQVEQRPIDVANAKIKEAARQQRARTSNTGEKINVKSKTRGPLPVTGGGGDRPPRVDGTAAAAGRPLTPQFLVQLFEDQAEWLEGLRKKLGYRSRAEAIRLVIDKGMIGLKLGEQEKR